MGQEDYFLREIEKIGIVLRAIASKLISGKENLSVAIEKNFEETSEMLLRESGFDLDKFLEMNSSETDKYISAFRGLNTENLELLADIIYILGKNHEQDKMIPLLEKALRLYETCSENDKTFSFERESKIGDIKSILEDNGRA